MIRAILIDDEPLMIEEMKLMLEENKYIKVVGAYSNPLEVIEQVKFLAPDCAFLDIEMPDINGIELAEKLLQEKPDIGIVFITAYNYYAAQAFEVNALDYILKPVRRERLNKAVEKILKYKNKIVENKKMNCSIRCFGCFEVLIDGKPLKWSRTKARELFAYLLQNEGNWISKYKICDDIWFDYSPEQALAYLQNSIWIVRKTLRENGCMEIKIEYASDRYILKVSSISWDVINFQMYYNEFKKNGSYEAARLAALEYKGEYLEGEDWQWADIIRERYILKKDQLDKRKRDKKDTVKNI